MQVARYRPVFASVQFYQGLHCSVTVSFDIVEYIDK